MVARRGAAYSSAASTEAMRREQTPLTSVLAVADNLPGVSVHEGDPFGFDDWSTTVSVRGFQLNLDEQQLGITVDGLPNGNSNYGGGAKAWLSASRQSATGWIGGSAENDRAHVAMKVTELVGRLRVANAWWLYGAYTVDASRYAGTGEAGVDASLGFEAGNRVAGVPADMLVGSLEWRGGRLRAGATHKVTRFPTWGRRLRHARGPAAKPDSSIC